MIFQRLTPGDVSRPTWRCGARHASSGCRRATRTRRRSARPGSAARASSSRRPRGPGGGPRARAARAAGGAEAPAVTYDLLPLEIATEAVRLAHARGGARLRGRRRRARVGRPSSASRRRSSWGRPRRHRPRQVRHGRPPVGLARRPGRRARRRHPRPRVRVGLEARPMLYPASRARSPATDPSACGCWSNSAWWATRCARSSARACT